MKICYITHPIKLTVKDEIQSELFYLFCDVPPKYIPSMHKNMLSKRSKPSLNNLKYLKCLCFVNLCVCLCYMK